MPRFFFHLDNSHHERDDEGTELPDPNVARIEAVRFAGAYMSDEPGFIWDGREFRVEVTDESKQLLMTVLVKAFDAEARPRR